jgi:hypothetical protein
VSLPLPTPIDEPVRPLVVEVVVFERVELPRPVVRSLFNVGSEGAATEPARNSDSESRLSRSASSELNCWLMLALLLSRPGLMGAPLLTLVLVDELELERVEFGTAGVVDVEVEELTPGRSRSRPDTLLRGSDGSGETGGGVGSSGPLGGGVLGGVPGARPELPAELWANAVAARERPPARRREWRRGSRFMAIEVEV